MSPGKVKNTAQRVSGVTVASVSTLSVNTSLPGMFAGSATLAVSRSWPGRGSGTTGSRLPTIGTGSGMLELPAGDVTRVLPGTVQAVGTPATVTVCVTGALTAPRALRTVRLAVYTPGEA